MDGRDRMSEADANAMRAAAARVLASEPFSGAPQLSAFLAFIVERAAQGRASELKGYTIAVEALGRPAEFNPQLDPIVRVEAGRLRRALAQYYAGEGAGDPERISVPLGGYVPTLEAAEMPTEGPAERERPATSSQAVFVRWSHLRGRVHAGLLTILLIVLGAAAAAVWFEPSAQPPAVSGRLAMQSSAPRLPSIALRIDEAGTDPAAIESAQNFLRLLVDAMARFDDVVSVRQPQQADGADYVLDLSARHVDEAVQGFTRLQAVADGRIVWTSSSVRSLSGTDPSRIAEKARRIAARLAESYGIIHADFRQHGNNPAVACLGRALEARRAPRATTLLAARNCIESTIAGDRLFQPAWSELAFLILDEYGLGHNRRPGAALDRALSAALTAIRLGPSSARARQALMDVLFVRGATESALESGRAALERNPYDPGVMAALGARLVQADRAGEGLPLLERAIEISGGRPAWYDFFAQLPALLAPQRPAPETASPVLLADDGFYGLLGEALRLSGTDDAEDARQRAGVLARLAMVAPFFAADPRATLSRLGFAKPVTDRILQRLGPEALKANRR